MENNFSIYENIAFVMPLRLINFNTLCLRNDARAHPC